MQGSTSWAGRLHETPVWVWGFCFFGGLWVCGHHTRFRLETSPIGPSPFWDLCTSLRSLCTVV
jgi:hypothetical protein